MTMGRLDLQLDYPSIYFQYSGRPVAITVNGGRVERPWGRHVFDLVPGQHNVRVAVVGQLFGDGKVATTTIPIYAGMVTAARYSIMYFLNIASLKVISQYSMQQQFPAPG